MRKPKITILRAVLAILAGAGCLLIGGPHSITSGNFVSTASAIIGRPATPMSYAGVGRRTTRRVTRRTVGYGAAAATAYGAAAYAPGTCVQAVDAYGRIYTRCY